MIFSESVLFSPDFVSDSCVLQVSALVQVYVIAVLVRVTHCDGLSSWMPVL